MAPKILTQKNYAVSSQTADTEVDNFLIWISDESGIVFPVLC